MANTVTVSGITDYVNIHRDELFVKSVAGAKTLDFIEIMTNVKYKDALNYLDSTVILDDGSLCQWDPKGTDVFTERYIETKPVKVEKEYCWKDFRKKWMNYQLQWEAGRATMPVEEKIADSNLNAIQMAVEEMLWRGNDTVGISGFTDLISAETAAVKVEFGSGSTTTAKVDAMVAALPLGALKKGVRLFMSYTDFRAYIAEQNASCCANRPIIDANVESLKYLGDSRITIVPVPGLELRSSADTAYMVAATEDALVYATDIEDSESVLKWFYDEKPDTFNFRVLFLAGTAVKFPDQCAIGAEA